MKTDSRSVAVFLIVIAAIAVGGCTDDQASQPTVATAAGGPSAYATTSPSAAAESDYDKALRYTRCMNALGDKVPDPVEGKPLQITARPLDGSGWQAESPNFAKCKHFLPATWPVKADPQDLARERAYAECMRKNGIDYPMPDADGVIAYPADPTTLGGTEFKVAQDACREMP